MAEIRVRGKNELDAARSTTAGMVRGEASLSEKSYAVEVRTQPGAVSGWHHHGDHETYGYLLAGKLRFEFGPGGEDVVEAVPGDFFMVPPNTIHREGNPSSEDQILVGFRVGSGPTVVNVDGPEGFLEHR